MKPFDKVEGGYREEKPAKKRGCCRRKNTTSSPLFKYFLAEGGEQLPHHADCIERDMQLDLDKVQQKFTYDVDDWLSMIVATEGRTMPWKPLLLTMSFTALIVLIHERYVGLWPGFRKGVNVTVHSSFGVVLGFLIVYQSGQSSKRWWEARCCWENIMVQSKEAMRVLTAHCDIPEVIALFGMHLTAFAFTTKHFLRGTKDPKDWKDELMYMLDEDDVDRIMAAAPRMRPVACLYAAQRCVEYIIQQKVLERAVSRDINPRLTTLADQLGACERILYTPLPWVYTLHLRFIIMMYLVILPLVFTENNNNISFYGMFFYCGIIGYAFLGLEDMALEIQNPFGYDYSDLPLDVFTHIVFQDIKKCSQLKYILYGEDYTAMLNQLCDIALQEDQDDH